MKTKIYNVVIIDESGSMTHLTDNVIRGYNDLLGEIKKSQLKNKEVQEHLITLVLFDNPNNIKVVSDKADLLIANELSRETYRPRGCTALYDAIGITLTNLEPVVDADEDGLGMVTIITDGYENASVEFSGNDIYRIIGRLREKGWDFNFMGAGADFLEVAKNMNIVNACQWETSQKGTREMFASESQQRSRKSDIMYRMTRDEQYESMTKAQKAAKRKSIFDAFNLSGED